MQCVVLVKAGSRIQFYQNILQRYPMENVNVDRIVYMKRMYALSVNGYIIDICINLQIKYFLYWLPALIISLAPKYVYRWFYLL